MGYKSAPLTWFDAEGQRVTVLSHLSHFKNAVMHATTASTDDIPVMRSADALALGLSGEITSIPSGTVYSAVLYSTTSPTGATVVPEMKSSAVDRKSVPFFQTNKTKKSLIRDTLYAWGKFVHSFVRRGENRKKVLPDAEDPVLAYLGFFTDNGAQFYGDSYNRNVPRGTGRDINVTCCTSDKIYPVLRKSGGGNETMEHRSGRQGQSAAADPADHSDRSHGRVVPQLPPTQEPAPIEVPKLRYLQLDDWWYRGVYPSPQDWGVKCVEDWRFAPDVPASRNFSDFATSIPNASLMLYGPFFCPNNTLMRLHHGEDAVVPGEEQNTTTSSLGHDDAHWTWTESGTMPVLTPNGLDGSAVEVYAELFRRARQAFRVDSDVATIEHDLDRAGEKQPTKRFSTSPATPVFRNFEIDFMNELFLRSA
ncbi:unnamed protein product, partial [Amoebophrya sp. A120]